MGGQMLCNRAMPVVVLMSLVLLTQYISCNLLDEPRHFKRMLKQRRRLNYHVDVTCSISMKAKAATEGSEGEEVDPVVSTKVVCDSGDPYEKEQRVSEMKETKIREGITLFTTHRAEGAAYVLIDGPIRFWVRDSTFSNLPPFPDVDSLAPLVVNGSMGRITDCVFEKNLGFQAAGALYVTTTVFQTKVEVLDSRMSENHAVNSGAILVDRHAKVDVSKTSLWRNEGNVSGAVRVLDYAHSYFSYCAFKGVGATEELLRFVNGETEVLTEGSAPQVGAVSVENFGRCEIDSCNFTNFGAELGTIMTTARTDVDIEDSNFISNVAGSGGAIHVDGIYGQNTAIAWSYFSANRARHGGALTVLGEGQFSVFLSQFVQNRAQNGGVLFGDFSSYESNAAPCERASQGTRISMNESEFRENRANLSGGAIFAKCTQILIFNNKFISNFAGEHGGGIYLNTGFQLDTKNCHYQNNTGKLSGGAIYAYNTTLVELESCKILENSAGPGGGGALYATGLDTIHLDGTTVANNTAKGSGGALALRKVFQMKVENSKLEENHSQKSGGGAHLESVQEAYWLASTFLQNSARDSGGAIAAVAAGTSTMNVSKCKFNQNEAASMNGGAISALNLGSFLVVDTDDGVQPLYRQRNGNLGVYQGSSFLNNSAAGMGGAIFVSGTTNMTVDSASIGGNVANEGGAVYSTGVGSFQMIDSQLQANNATVGGGIVVSGSKSMRIERSELLQNFARETGGGASLINVSKVEMTGTKFVENSAHFGGGVQLMGATNLFADMVVFKRNEAGKEGGGLVCSDETSVDMARSTFDYNYAPTAGSIFAACSCNITAERCAFHRDKKKKNNGDFFLSARSCASIDTAHCLFRGGIWKFPIAWVIVIVCVLAVIVSIGVGSIRICVVAVKKKKKKRQEEAAGAPLLGRRSSDDISTGSSWSSSSYSDVSDDVDVEKGGTSDQGPSTAVQSRSLGAVIKPASMSGKGSESAVASAPAGLVSDSPDQFTACKEQQHSEAESGPVHKAEINDIETGVLSQKSTSMELEAPLSQASTTTTDLMSPKSHPSQHGTSQCYVKVELQDAPGTGGVSLVIIPYLDPSSTESICRSSSIDGVQGTLGE